MSPHEMFGNDSIMGPARGRHSLKHVQNKANMSTSIAGNPTSELSLSLNLQHSVEEDCDTEQSNIQSLDDHQHQIEVQDGEYNTEDCHILITDEAEEEDE